MIRFFLSISAVLILTLPALAQESEDAAAEEPVITFPLDREEAGILALQRIPGEIVSADGYEDDDDFIFAFEILRADGTVMEINLNSGNGRIEQLRVKMLGEGAELPPPQIGPENARGIALNHIETTTTGRTKPKVEQEEYTLSDGVPVYAFRIKKRSNRYAVTIDARTGRILEVRRGTF